MRERESVLLLFLLLQAVVLASCTQGAPFILFHFVFGYFLFESPKFFFVTYYSRSCAGRGQQKGEQRERSVLCQEAVAHTFVRSSGNLVPSYLSK